MRRLFVLVEYHRDSYQLCVRNQKASLFETFSCHYPAGHHILCIATLEGQREGGVNVIFGPKQLGLKSE